MAEQDPTEELTGRLERIERCDQLISRARAQDGYGQDVVQHVVDDLSRRRDELVIALKTETPRADQLLLERRAVRDACGVKLNGLKFRVDVLNLRGAIGDVDPAAELAEITSEIEVTENELAEVTASCVRLSAVVERCREAEAAPEDPAITEPSVDEYDADASDSTAPDIDDRLDLREIASFEESDIEPIEMLPEGPEGPEDEPEEALLIVNEGTTDEICWPLTTDRIHIGRAASNEVTIRGDAKVSRTHLALFRRDGRWWAEDQRSANQTLVNGEILMGARRLYGGEELIVGETFLRIRIGPARDPDERPLETMR